MAWRQQTVVADLDEAFGQDVVEQPPQKLVGPEGNGLAGLGGKGDGVVGHAADAVVG